MENTKFSIITNENIHLMVRKFYATILAENNDVAKVFISKLGDNLDDNHWKEHIDTLTNFWSMIALGETNYMGNPMMAHFDLPLSRDMFGAWLVMFFNVIDSLYEPHLGNVFKVRAEDIANNFMRNMQL